MDKNVICWDIKKENLVFVSRGHEGTITCIHVNDYTLVTGSADKSIIVWCSKSGKKICQVYGHSSGVSSVQCGINGLVSGSTDGEIIVWDKEVIIENHRNKNTQLTNAF